MNHGKKKQTWKDDNHHGENNGNITIILMNNVDIFMLIEEHKD